MVHNKTLLGVSVFLFVFFAIAQSYTYITQISTHPDYPYKCYDTDTKNSYVRGETFKYLGKCEEATCGREFRFSVRGCGIVDITGLDCMEYQQDYYLPYPLCCQKYRCTGENGKILYA